MKAYPNTGQSVGITFIVIASMLVFVALNYILNDLIGKEASLFVYYGIAVGVPAIGLHFFRKKKNGSAKYNLKPQDGITILSIMLIVLGIQFGVTSPITNLIPMSDWIKEAFLELAEMNGIFGFLTIAIAAPILEEFIFRGIVLDGLLKNYSPWKAILISSLLFGFVHLNPWQFIGATIIGFFIGWVYYKTNNLLYCMLIHFANNGFAFLLMQFSSPEEMLNESLIESYGGLTNMLIIIPISLLVIVLGILFLKKRFAQNPLILDEPASL